jgi:outer membrane receptor for ferrienterochelin and colicins
VVGSVRAWLLISGFLLLAPGALHAAEGADEPDEVVKGGEIVVQERVLEPAEIYEDAPVETEIITEDEIVERPARNAEDVVENLTGVRVQRRLQGEEAAVSIDGMPPEYTRILVNGQRYSGEIGEVDDLRDVPLENVERIEVLRGTQGLAYGTDSAGGVIQVITKDPPLEGVRMNTNLGGGSDAAFLGSGTAAFGLGWGGWSVSTVQDQIDGFEASDSDPPPAPLVAPGDGRRLSRDVYQTLFVPVGDRLVLRTRGGWRREDETFNFYDDDTDTDPKTQRDYTRWLGAQEYEWFADESTRVAGALRFFQGETDSDVGREFLLDEDEWRLETKAERFFTTGELPHVVTLGFDVRRPTLDLDEGDAGIALPFEIEDVDETFYASGVYLQSETEVAEWASLLLGVRGEFHSEFDARALPQVGLLFRPCEGLKLRAGWGQNYRTPSLRDLYQPPVPQVQALYFLAGNPDLDPESSQSWRLGFEWNPRPWLALAATGFWNDIDDAIRSTLDGSIDIGVPPPRNLFRKQNLDEVRTRGVETRLLLRPHARFDFWLGYTYMDTEVLDSNVDLDELPNTPRNVLDAGATLRLPHTETAFTLQARWRDRAKLETSGTGLLGFGDIEETDPSLFVDLRILQPIRRGLELYLDVDNIGDQRVEDSYPVRGRTFFIGLRARLDTTPKKEGDT